MIFREYNFTLPEGELLSVSLQGDPLVTTPTGSRIIYNKRTPNGVFLERYIQHGEGFASVDLNWMITNTYTRSEGEFEYGANVKYVRDDGRVYFAWNHAPFSNAPYALEIKSILDSHSLNPVEIIFALKPSGPQIYIIEEA